MASEILATWLNEYKEIIRVVFCFFSRFHSAYVVQMQICEYISIAISNKCVNPQKFVFMHGIQDKGSSPGMPLRVPLLFSKEF